MSDVVACPVLGVAIHAGGALLAATCLKELNLAANQGRSEFSLARGLAVSVLAGVLPAVYGLLLEAGEPIAGKAW